MAFAQRGLKAASHSAPRMAVRGMSLAVPSGRGGRSSVSGIQATVFGATGLLGRYTVNKLGRVGSQVVVPFRSDEHETRHLKVMGDYGQIVMVPYHLKDSDSIAHVTKEANCVINLMGQQQPTWNFTLHQANVEGVRAIATAAKAAGAERFIHISALQANENSVSAWARTKAEGEKVVKEIFPDATILRPGSMFGPEDKFLTRIAAQASTVPIFGTVNNAKALRSPIFVEDVAQAIMICMRDPATIGKTYDLAGPSVYTLGEIHDKIFAVTALNPLKVNMPQFVMGLQGRIAERLPGSQYLALTEDETKLMLEDEVVADGALTIADLGIKPVAMEEKIGKFLLRFKPPSISSKDAGVLL